MKESTQWSSSNNWFHRKFHQRRKLSPITCSDITPPLTTHSPSPTSHQLTAGKVWWKQEAAVEERLAPVDFCLASQTLTTFWVFFFLSAIFPQVLSLVLRDKRFNVFRLGTSGTFSQFNTLEHWSVSGTASWLCFQWVQLLVHSPAYAELKLWTVVSGPKLFFFFFLAVKLHFKKNSQTAFNPHQDLTLTTIEPKQ